MLELYRSKLLQNGINHSLLRGNALLLNKTSNALCQTRLKSNIYRPKNDFKLALSSPLNNVLIKKEFTRGLKVAVIGGKNDEMWKKYRTLDPRVIRPIDGSEFFVSNYYINVSDIFPKISTEEFRKRAQENFSNIELFNLALK